MDTWIIADSDFVLTRISDALHRQGIDCPPTQVLKSADGYVDVEQVADFTGIVFIGTTQLHEDAFDLIRRVRAAVDVEAKLALVAFGADHGVVLKAVRAGVSDLLDANASLDDEIANFIARIRLESRHKVARGRVITVAPCHAPADANVLASNVAAVIASYMKTCGVLDFHFRGGDLAILLKLTPRHTIMDLLSQTETIDEVMFRQALTAHDIGIELLAGPPALADMKAVGGAGVSTDYRIGTRMLARCCH